MPHLSESRLWLDPPSFPLGPPGSWVVDRLCTLRWLLLSEHLKAGRILDSSTEAGLVGTLCIRDLSPRPRCLDSSLQEDTPRILPGEDTPTHGTRRPRLPKDQ